MQNPKRLKPTFLQTGGGVPNGGTKHAGHAYWSSTITPFQAASVIPSPPEPSLYARPIVFNLPSIVTKPYGIKGLSDDSSNLLKEVLNLFKRKSVVGGGDEGGPFGGGPSGGGPSGGGPGGGGPIERVPSGGGQGIEDDYDFVQDQYESSSTFANSDIGGPFQRQNERLYENSNGRLVSTKESNVPVIEEDFFDAPEIVENQLIPYPQISIRGFNTPVYIPPIESMQLNDSIRTFNIDPLPVSTDLKQALQLGVTDEEMRQVEEFFAEEEANEEFEKFWIKHMKELEEANKELSVKADEDLYERLMRIHPLPDTKFEQRYNVLRELYLKRWKKGSQIARQNLRTKLFSDAKTKKTEIVNGEYAQKGKFTGIDEAYKKLKIVTKPIQNVDLDSKRFAIDVRDETEKGRTGLRGYKPINYTISPTDKAPSPVDNDPSFTNKGYGKKPDKKKKPKKPPN